jgi:hypothetical protein
MKAKNQILGLLLLGALAASSAFVQSSDDMNQNNHG